MCEILFRTRGNAGVVVHSMAPGDVDAAVRLPYAAIISDALYGEGPSHPRRYGAFTRALRDLVHERKVLTLAEAVHKMTELPARRLGICDVGALSPGMRADICVFDPTRVRDHATYAEPERMSTGMDMVLMNGRIVWREEQPLDAPGASRVVLA